MAVETPWYSCHYLITGHTVKTGVMETPKTGVKTLCTLWDVIANVWG